MQLHESCCRANSFYCRLIDRRLLSHALSGRSKYIFSPKRDWLIIFDGIFMAMKRGVTNKCNRITVRVSHVVKTFCELRIVCCGSSFEVSFRYEWQYRFCMSLFTDATTVSDYCPTLGGTNKWQLYKFYSNGCQRRSRPLWRERYAE